MSLKEFIYIISCALQIAGAVLLILKYWGRTLPRIIDLYYPGTGIAGLNDQDNAVLEVELVRTYAREIYDSRMAFVYIALGYAFAVLGKKESTSGIVLLIFIAFVTCILIWIEKIVSKIIARYFYTHDVEIPCQELPERIPTSLTREQVDSIRNLLNHD